MSTRISAGVDDCPCFCSLYYYGASEERITTKIVFAGVSPIILFFIVFIKALQHKC